MPACSPMPFSIGAIGMPLSHLHHLLRRSAVAASNSVACSSPVKGPARRPSCFASYTPPVTYIMSPQINYSSATANKRPLSEPRPSSSVLLLSPQNQVLLLHRVQTSSSFASAHVFPGGNLDPFHDGVIPAAGSTDRHQDGLAYRLGAIRETFEETGILLAKKDGELVNLSIEERDAARKKIHGNETSFLDWCASLGAEPDTVGLVPFTRWITPTINPKRFTTQMYLYMLPLTRNQMPSEMLIPTPDNGIEHTAALFAPARTFLSQASANSIILFPPQAYLLHLVATIFASTSAPPEDGHLHLASQREKLLAFISSVPTAGSDKGKQHKTALIPWSDKVMSPHTLFLRKSDNRVVLALDKPGPELKDSDRGGDWARVVLVNFGKGGPTNVEVRGREEVLQEEKDSNEGVQKL